MPAGQQIPQEAPGSASGQSTLHDLFALTNEQILEIEPDAPDVPVSADSHPLARDPWPLIREEKPNNQTPASIESSANRPSDEGAKKKRNIDSQTGANRSSTGHETRSSEHDPEPPAWLAAQMKDPWSGEEARELWNGVQQARQEAAAYRAAFATPEDARALKELYPGGVNEARAAAERARVLDDIDRAYFGAMGGTPQQTSAARAQLAAMMLREDPAAFREMVFAGLRVLEEAEKGSGDPASDSNLPKLAQVVNRISSAVAQPEAYPGPVGGAVSSAVELQLGHGDAGQRPGIPAAASSGPLAAVAANEPGTSVVARHAVPASADASVPDAHVAAYAAFEKAANEDLERSVGAAIAHTLQRALPNLAQMPNASSVGAQHAAHLQERLNAAVRQDVEAALKGDRQLSEQIAQILSARRFDSETRAQVVRLIDDRARQLVPVAAKRVLNDWTQTTLAAHRLRQTQRRADPQPVVGEAVAASATNS